MRLHLFFLIAALSLQCTNKQKIEKSVSSVEKESPFFKQTLEAEYSPKQSGYKPREVALKNDLTNITNYNQQGKSTDYTIIRELEIYQKTELVRNEFGKIEKGIRKDAEGNIISQLEYFYDDQKNPIEIRTYDRDGELTNTQRHTYDKNGNELSMELQSAGSPQVSKTTFEYDDLNRLIKKIRYKYDGSIRSERTFEYDDGDQPTVVYVSQPDGYFLKMMNQYDENGNFLQDDWYDKDGKHTHTTAFEYVYDEYGNWLTKKRYSDGKLGYVWERKIIYYF